MRASHRALGVLALVLSACVAPATRAPEPLAPFDAAIADLTHQLVATAASRTAVGSMRVVVDRIEPAEPATGELARVAGRELATDAFSDVLGAELTEALSLELHVFADGPGDESLAERAQRLGATHAVVGSWIRDRGQVDVSLRLVDLGSGLIVAPARVRFGYEAVDAYERVLKEPISFAVVEEQPAPVALPPVALQPDVVSPVVPAGGSPPRTLSTYPNALTATTSGESTAFESHPSGSVGEAAMGPGWRRLLDHAAPPAPSGP